MNMIYMDPKVITLCGISIAVNFFKKGNLTLLAIQVIFFCTFFDFLTCDYYLDHLNLAQGYCCHSVQVSMAIVTEEINDLKYKGTM